MPTSKKNPINVHMQLEGIIFFFFEGLGLGVELYIKDVQVSISLGQEILFR